MINKYLIGGLLVATSSLISIFSKTKGSPTTKAAWGQLLAISTSPDANDGPTCITGSGLQCDHTTTGCEAGESESTELPCGSEGNLGRNATNTGTTIF